MVSGLFIVIFLLILVHSGLMAHAKVFGFVLFFLLLLKSSVQEIVMDISQIILFGDDFSVSTTDALLVICIAFLCNTDSGLMSVCI